MVPQQLPPTKPQPAPVAPVTVTPVAQPAAPVTLRIETPSANAIEEETKQRLEQAAADNAGLKQIISNLQQRQDELTSELLELQQARDELAAIASDSQQREQEYRTAIDGLKQDLETSQQNVLMLQGESEAFQNQLEDLQTQRQQLQDQIQAVSLEREKLSTDLVSMNMDLSNERQSRSIEIAAFNEARDDLVQQIEGLRQQLVDLTNEEMILQQAQQQCAQTLSATNDEMTLLQNNRDTISAQLDQALAELSEQLKQTQLAISARDMCIADSNDKTIVIQQLQSELKRVIDDRSVLQAQLNQMKNEFLNMLEKMPV
jgi:chromosome segregation ATPase